MVVLTSDQQVRWTRGQTVTQLAPVGLRTGPEKSAWLILISGIYYVHGLDTYVGGTNTFLQYKTIRIVTKQSVPYIVKC